MHLNKRYIFETMFIPKQQLTLTSGKFYQLRYKSEDFYPAVRRWMSQWQNAHVNRGSDLNLLFYMYFAIHRLRQKHRTKLYGVPFSDNLLNKSTPPPLVAGSGFFMEFTGFYPIIMCTISWNPITDRGGGGKTRPGGGDEAGGGETRQGERRGRGRQGQGGDEAGGDKARGETRQGETRPGAGETRQGEMRPGGGGDEAGGRRDRGGGGLNYDGVLQMSQTSICSPQCSFIPVFHDTHFCQIW